MYVIMILGIAYMIYGLAGIFGFQKVPEQYQNRSFTGQYKQASGLGWLLLGIPCVILYVIAENSVLTTQEVFLLTLILYAPEILYLVIMDRKFKKKLEQEKMDSELSSFTPENNSEA